MVHASAWWRPFLAEGFASMAGHATVILAVAGALWFGILSLGAVIVYAPVGVEPREVGLSSGTVLTQAAIVALAYLIVSVLFGVIVMVIVRRVFPKSALARGRRRGWRPVTGRVSLDVRGWSPRSCDVHRAV